MTTLGALTGLRPQRISWPATVYILLLLATTRVLLRAIRYHRTHGLLKTIAALRRPRAVVADRALFDAITHDVAIAGALFPGRARCLEQSLVVWYLLRARHIDARIRFGIRPDTVVAHAWVECDSAPVNETTEAIDRFVPLPEFAQ
jgi:hypothetical protein